LFGIVNSWLYPSVVLLASQFSMNLAKNIYHSDFGICPYGKARIFAALKFVWLQDTTRDLDIYFHGG